MQRLAVRPLGGLLLLSLVTIAACSGDSQIFKTQPVARGLAIESAGLDPIDPLPLDAALASLSARDAERAWVHVSIVHEDVVAEATFDPGALEFEAFELMAVTEPDARFFRRYEASLDARGDEHALYYWFEVEATESVAFPAAGPSASFSVASQPIEIDFAWPDWPQANTPPCLSDRDRILDGAEDEATLAVAPPFDVIRDALWVPVNQASALGNLDNLTRGIGVEAGGQAYFFPLAVMLWNEVSNHPIGGRQTAMSYCPLTDTAVHFDTGFDPESPPKWRNYAPAGLFNSNLCIGIEGLANGQASAFNQMLGFAFNGPEVERCLEVLPSIMTEFSVWHRLHPETLVLNGDPASVEEFNYTGRQNPYSNYWRIHEERRAPVAHEDSRLPSKSLVMGVLGDGAPLAIPLDDEEFVYHGEVQGVPLVVFYQAKTAVALDRRHPTTQQALTFTPSRTSWRGFPLYQDDQPDPSLWTMEGVAVAGPARGQRLAWVPSMSAFWFAWFAIYPETDLVSPAG